MLDVVIFSPCLPLQTQSLDAECDVLWHFLHCCSLSACCSVTPCLVLLFRHPLTATPLSNPHLGNRTTPRNSRPMEHLSQYAVEQLTAAGVSSQLSQQIQSSPQPCTAPLQVPGTANQADSQMLNNAASSPHTSSSTQHATGKGISNSSSNVKSSSLKDSSRVQGSSSKADFRKKAHLLRVRQEQILDRIRSLGTDEARSRSGSSSSSSNTNSNSSSNTNSGSGSGSSSVGVDNAEAGLQWQRLAPQLQVVYVAVALLAQYARFCMLVTCLTTLQPYKT